MLKRIWSIRRSVLFAWLISYLCILLLPISISIVVNYQFNSTLREETHRANISLLNQLRQEIDNHLENIMHLSTELYFDPKLQSLGNASEFNRTYSFDLYDMTRDLILYKTSYPFLDQFYIYLKNQNIVLLPGTQRSGIFAFETLHGKTGMTYEEWHAMVEQRGYQGFKRVPRLSENGQTRHSVAYISSMPISKTEPPFGASVLMIDESKLLDIINNVKLFDGGRILILNKQMQVLVASDSPESVSPPSYDGMTGDSGLMYTTYNGKKTEVFYRKSENGQLTYISEIPSRLYWEKAESMRNLMYMSILVSLLGGCLLTIFFIRRNYDPLNRIIRSFTEATGLPFEQKKNEFLYIHQELTSMIGEKEKNNRLILQQHAVLRANVLVRLLKGEWDSRISLKEAMAAFRISFDSDEFAVILFYFEDVEQFFKRMENMNVHDKWKLMRFIVTNVLEDMARQFHGGYTVEMDETIVLLVNLRPGDIAWQKQELLQIAQKAKQFFFEKFRIESTMSVSMVQRSAVNIGQAYREALGAMEYKLVRGSRNILCYDDIRQETAKEATADYYYPLHIEKQWMNLVKVGDFDKASGLLREIIERNFSGAPISVQMARCLIFDLVGTLIKTLRENQLEESLFMNGTVQLDKLLACETIQDMERELTETLRQVCEFALARRKQNLQAKRHLEVQALINKIVLFVQENYSDCNLNVSMIGYRFGMKPAYLSKLFKEQTGIALLDFINQVRIDQAKQLLLGNHASINEISALVGFNDVTVFFRLFKKYEGVTPGKFKESF